MQRITLLITVLLVTGTAGCVDLNKEPDEPDDTASGGAAAPYTTVTNGTVQAGLLGQSPLPGASSEREHVTWLNASANVTGWVVLLAWDPEGEATENLSLRAERTMNGTHDGEDAETNATIVDQETGNGTLRVVIDRAEHDANITEGNDMSNATIAYRIVVATDSDENVLYEQEFTLTMVVFSGEVDADYAPEQEAATA